MLFTVRHESPPLVCRRLRWIASSTLVSMERSAPGRPRRAAAVALSHREQMRARLVAKLVGERAERDQLVCATRVEILSGGPLEPEEALRFLKSPAPRFLSLSRYRGMGPPEDYRS